VEEKDIRADSSLIGRIEICYPQLPKELWKKATSLRWLQSNWTGVDALLAIPGAQAHPAVITNVHVQPQSMTEHMWGMALSLTRNLHVSSRLQAQGVWDNKTASTGLSSLADRWLCIAGFGAIGSRCAAVGRVLGMRVIGISRGGRPHPLADEMVGPERRAEAFARARVIMLLLPDTSETRGFVGTRELDAMNGAFLLNAGRGTAIDTSALVSALTDGRVRGAGLDVTDPEPLPAGHPLWSMPNVLISPHYAGVHPGYDEEAFEVFIANLERWMKGQTLQGVVDRALGY
jgi:phosphoglycerate dehydrogenase-like enzyme